MWCRALTVKDTGGQCGLYDTVWCRALTVKDTGDSVVCMNCVVQGFDSQGHWGQCGLYELCGAGR